MKLSTKPNLQILKTRPTTSPSLPYTYPDDMLRQKRASTPPDHLLKLIRKLAENQQNQSTTSPHQSYPPISNKQPEKTILKKSKSKYRRTKSEDFVTDSDSSISDNLDTSIENTLPENNSQLDPKSTTHFNHSVNSISTISGSESETICSDIESASETSEFSENQISAQFNVNSSPIKRRSVIFADTIGKPLERVRLISESREDPPKFLLNNNRPTYFSAFSSGYNSTNSDLSPTDDEEEEFFRQGCSKSSIFGCRENKNDSRGQRDVQSLIKLIEALKHSKNKDADKTRNCSYPIDASKALKVHNTHSIDSTYSKLTHSAFRKFNPCFAQPAINTALLMQRLSKYNVTLERSTITNTPTARNSLKFRGTILCKNIDFTKIVKVHYSTNNWLTTKDTVARWRRTNLDCTHDIFDFEQDLGECDEVKCDEIKTVQFCIRYNTSSEEFWDNNDGKNYSFQ